LRYSLAGLVALIILALARRTRPHRAECWLVLWALTVLSMYLALFIEYRYAAPWLILFWIAAYSACLSGNGKIEQLLFIVLAVGIIVPRLNGLKQAYVDLAKNRGPSMDVRVARELNQLGIRSGDTIAIVNDGFNHYYAHIADVRIIAQITSEPAFWSLSGERALTVERAVALTGAKVLLGRGRPENFQPGAWRVVPSTPYSILPLDKIAPP
jgi:hypothetical protein